MATINFYAGGYNLPISNLSGSGLGFFGSTGFGASVPVGSYQGSTFITDGNGVNQGPQANNVTWVHPNSGIVQNGTIVNNQNIPNYQSTLNMRLTNPTPVRTQNAKVYIYDRANINNAPSGVVVALCPIIHPDTSQATVGSGSAQWQFPAGSSYVNMSVLSNGAIFSPGQSGYSPNGGSTIDMTHDWYMDISVSPNSIGAKTQVGLWGQTEYL